MTSAMQRAPMVSVVIPTYNRAEIIGRAIRSVQAQTFEDWELIVVDDASEDETEEVVGAFEDTRIRYIQHVENRGGAAARNTGIRNSRGEYIAFLDSDDEWLPHKLEGQLQVFKENDENVGLVYTGMIRKKSKYTKKNPPSDSGWIEKKLYLKNVIGSCSVGMIKNSVVNKIGYFDKKLDSAQDKDYWLRISKTFKIEFLKGCHVLKHERDSPNQIGNDPIGDPLGKIKFFKKHEKGFEKKKASKYLIKIGRKLDKRGDKNTSYRALIKKAFSKNPTDLYSVIHLLYSYIPSSYRRK